MKPKKKMIINSEGLQKKTKNIKRHKNANERQTKSVLFVLKLLPCKKKQKRDVLCLWSSHLSWINLIL